jgi:ubiquinone/menaquinone biosynthesis C-methylase UbiE
MQDTSGFKSLLSVSWVYKYFQILVGAAYGRNWIATKYWRLQGGEKVIDIGCGPGDILEYLPRDIEYVGFDISPEYIEAARKKWGKRATFVVGTPSEMKRRLDSQLCGANLVMCNGVLHHLDDRETLDVLELTKAILAPGGRFVCLEPVFLVHQGWISRWFMSRDRGQHVREESQWKELFGQVFENYTSSIATHLIRIPYTYIIFECDKPK